MKDLLDIQKIRLDFPILNRKVHGRPLVYLDNAATTQKPEKVINRIREYYLNMNSNVHRGVHELSNIATQAYEEARQSVRDFLHARNSKEIIFTRGTTEAINLVARSYGEMSVHKGDEILISAMEHHSNIVPWQNLCAQTGALLRVIPINDRGDLEMQALPDLLSSKVKLLALTHVSNTLGTINPLKEIIADAHQKGIPVLIDGAQAAAHLQIDVQELDCDFYCFSGHKLFGPTGIGVLYGKQELLEEMPPYQFGGDMIRSVTFEKTTYNELPYKFEAGTPNIEGALGLSAAISYLFSIDLKKARAHEEDLTCYATQALQNIQGLKIIGEALHKVAILSFVLEGVHPHDIGTILDNEGIAIRTGHHCTQPLMERFNVPATARVSMAFYNTKNEIDSLVSGLKTVREVFR